MTEGRVRRGPRPPWQLHGRELGDDGRRPWRHVPHVGGTIGAAAAVHASGRIAVGRAGLGRGLGERPTSLRSPRGASHWPSPRPRKAAERSMSRLTGDRPGPAQESPSEGLATTTGLRACPNQPPATPRPRTGHKAPSGLHALRTVLRAPSTQRRQRPACLQRSSE